MELTVDPADFNLLVEHHVLAVDGEWPMDRDAPPPANLLALVGKACETCGGAGRVIWRQAIGYETARTEPCPDCHGTGSELLTVKTECETCGGLGGYEVEANGETCRHGKCRTCGHGQPNFDAPNYGIRSLLVRLTGQPVPVVNHYKLDILGGHSFIFVSGTGPTGVHLWDGSSWHRIDLGPNTASLIGRWVWLPDALEVVT